MLFRSRKIDLCCEPDTDDVADLHKLIFADTAPMPELDYGHWWLIYEINAPDDPIGFCGVVRSSYGTGHGYLKRAGVLPPFRGHGLQRRMIRLRETQGRKEGWHSMITETTDNPTSANNLIRAGYETFDPEWGGWSFPTAIYWRKRLVHQAP